MSPPAHCIWKIRPTRSIGAPGALVSGAGRLGGPQRPTRPLRRLGSGSRWAVKPVAISSTTGLRAGEKAFALLMQGAGTLDAVIEGVKIQELDPADDSVGYGGFPNSQGGVQLDPPCPHGPPPRAGAGGALEGATTPTEVAQPRPQHTKHSN